MTSRTIQAVATLAAAALLSVACVAAPVDSGPSSTAAVTSAATGAAGPSPAPSTDLSGLDKATAMAVQIRTSFGLRADLDFIRMVAADPTATSEFGTPLLPAEIREIGRRSEAADQIVPIVQMYAADKAAVFGGVWIDQAAGGTVTVSFTDELDHHREALALLLHGRGVVKVVQARYAEAPMRALQDRVAADSAWFKTVPAALRSVGYDIIGNALEIEVSTANANIATLISSRYGIPPDALHVISDGTGIAMEPWGTIHGRVVDVPAKVLVELSINYHSDRAGADCGSEVGLGLGAGATFELPCQGGHWVIEAIRTIDDVVARGEVDLLPGGEATVTLRPIAH